VPGYRNLLRVTAPTNDSRRYSTASNVWPRSNRPSRNASNVPPSAITKLTQVSLFTSIPSSDNGKEFKETDGHALNKACRQHGIGQKFTRINRPQTNGKVERVIRTRWICGTARLALKTAPIGAFSFSVSLTFTIPSNPIRV